VNWPTFAFRIVNVKLVGNCCPPETEVLYRKSKVKLPIVPFDFKLVLSPLRLKLLREPLLRTSPPVVLIPMSPPLSTSAYPEFIENVTFTFEPLWTQVTVPRLPEMPRLLMVNGALLAEAAGANSRLTMAATSRTANRQVAWLKAKLLLKTKTAYGS
jgi:hypothetical protein